MDQILIAKANVINFSFYNTLKGYMWKLQTLQIKNEAIIYFVQLTLNLIQQRDTYVLRKFVVPSILRESALYPFQSGCHFSVLLFACKLALVVSFKGNYSFEFRV